MTGSARIGMMALVVFLGLGLLILLRTPYPANAGQRRNRVRGTRRL